MQPAETLSVFEASQKTALMDGLYLVTESTDVTPVAVPVIKEPSRPTAILEVSDRMYCSACSRGFDSREEQAEHYRLDWHRFNIKQRLLGRRMLTAEEFEVKTQTGDVSSISGSDSSDSDSGNVSDPQPFQESRGRESSHQSPLLHLRSQKVLFRNSQGLLISVYRCVLGTAKGSREEPAEFVAAFQKQSPEASWVILMAGGGHFAGAVFKGDEVLQHKTFHRYTVRASRGTAQGVRDAQGSMPKSAGASLRRYNETALLKDIQELLASWAKHIEEAECIFLRAPRTNRACFFGGKKCPLQRNDPRIRGIPFSTRRATFHEVQRVHGVLSSLQVYGKDTAVADLVRTPRKTWKKVVHQDEPSTQCQESIFSARSEEEEEEEENGEENPEQLEEVELTLNTLELREFEVAPKRNHKKKRRKPKVQKGSCTETSGDVEDLKVSLSRSEKSAEAQKQLEAQGALSTSMQDALFTACKTGDTKTLHHLLEMVDSLAADEQEELNGATRQQLLNKPLDESGWTLLHVAAAAGRSAIVQLLLEAGADPALRDRQEQPPYCVSASKQTRAEFRRFMAEQPEKYDYVRAQVPGPLTTEMEARQAERRRAHKAQRKQREKEEREALRLLEQEEKEKQHFALLSDREKRALAAEQRLASQLKDCSASLMNIRRCWLCGKSLLGCVPFHYLDFSFCSTACLQAHRKGRAASS